MEVCFISVVFNHDCALESLGKLRKKAKKKKKKKQAVKWEALKGYTGYHYF